MPIPLSDMLSVLRRWAVLLDSRFRIPGTNIRFGIDPILSLVPGLGDVASPVFALALIAQGLAMGVPKVILVRMLVNALVDASLGLVPVAGNVADLFWRANTANLRLLEQFAQPGRRPSRGDYLLVFALAGAFGVIVCIVMLLAIWIAMAFWGRFS